MNDGENCIIDTLKSTVNKSISEHETKLVKLIDTKLDEKMEKVLLFGESMKQQNDTLNKISQSYADSAKEKQPKTIPTDFRQIIEETKNEERLQEREREVRARNVIIHGSKEAENNDEAKEEDNNTIKELLNILELEVIPEYITRLVISNGTKPRPIRLIFKTLSDKEMIMSSLPKLKTACERLKKISITEGYTFNECQAIKQKVVEAKQKTGAEGDGKYIWKVRGTPKNGLRLIRFNTITNANQQN